ncbi:MAG: ABC transporter substrate-binding protein [Longimicrobiales bacterium]
MTSRAPEGPAGTRALAALLVGAAALTACDQEDGGPPTLRWYVFDEPSGAFQEAARNCAEASGGAYRIELTPLPADANRQREQLVRRLAAGDVDIDIIGMDVIWTAEFAEAGWILPWEDEEGRQATEGRLEAPVESARYEGRVWAAPFTTNTQILWYRTDRVGRPPGTWQEMIEMAESLGDSGTIEAQGERYEGLTVFFTSLLASAGGTILEERDASEASPDSLGEGNPRSVALPREPTREALRVMHRLATSPASNPNLDRAREDQTRLAFETGGATFMVNYTYVWASARENAPEVAENMGWARWPGVEADRPGRVTVGGINLGVGAFSRHPGLAFQAAACIASAENQRIAAAQGGLPPTTASLYDEAEVRETFPFADLLRETLRDAVQRPRTPLYNDVSLAISHTLHPMSEIDPDEDLGRLRETVERALRSEGLL